jgi:hypothetical protein
MKYYVTVRKYEAKAIARRFQAQYGVAGRRELRALGISARVEQTRVASGEWDRPTPGVVRVVAAPRIPEQALMIGIIEAGADAVASHQSAAWLWDLLPAPNQHAVTVKQGNGRHIPHVSVHRLSDPPLVSVLRNIPCTNPLRTLVDLAAVAERMTVVDAVDRALAKKLVTVEGLEAEIRRLSRHGRRGVGVLRTVLAQRGMISGPPASVLESRTVRLLRSGGIEPIAREVKVGPDGCYRIDLTLDLMVGMEVDGYTYHRSAEAKAQDERRRNEIRLSGIFLLVYDWITITRDSRRVLAECRQALAKYGTRGAKLSG